MRSTLSISTERHLKQLQFLFIF